MNYAVRILTPADTDAVEAALWYEAQVAGLGAKFLTEVNASAQRLSTHPEIHQVRFADDRRAPISKFRFYGLFYLVQGNEVWVIAIHHARRNPRWLHERRRKIRE